MKDSRQNPSLFQIIWTDYPAFLACAVAIVAWIVYFAWIPDWRGRGPVIPPSVAPFYLTLAIVASGVKAHGGAVHVLSEPGQGATFVIELPLPPNQVEDESPAEEQELLACV